MGDRDDGAASRTTSLHSVSIPERSSTTPGVMDTPETPENTSLGDRDNLSGEGTPAGTRSSGKRCIEMSDRSTAGGWFGGGREREERRRMYMSERRLLTPTQKWRKFRKPPWKVQLPLLPRLPSTPQPLHP